VWFAGHVVEEPEVHLARRPETTGWARRRAEPPPATGLGVQAVKLIGPLWSTPWAFIIGRTIYHSRPAGTSQPN
jgi:hypothetical protein